METKNQRFSSVFGIENLVLNGEGYFNPNGKLVGEIFNNKN